MDRVVIVGGGVLGTMHAVMARQRGYAVTHLEREAEGRGASVRNFGASGSAGAGPALSWPWRGAPAGCGSSSARTPPAPGSAPPAR